jgi:hypothetical protein
MVKMFLYDSKLLSEPTQNPRWYMIFFFLRTALVASSDLPEMFF